MLAGVFAKTVRDRWLGWSIAVLSMAALFLMAMPIYDKIDLTLYEQMPAVYRSLIGIAENLDAGSLSIDALIGSYGALVVAAMALAMGAGAIASEERKGTLGLLLANPRSRTRVLLAKTAAMVALSTACVLALWGTIVGTAALFGVSIKGLDVGALSLHLLANTLFFGFLALAVGAWTGNRGAALGVSISVMVASFIGVGIFPLIQGWEDWVRVFPWHYFSGSRPLLNGIDWGDIGILVAACVVFGTVALVGVNRRDLKGQSTGVTLLDRLRAHPLTEKMIGRLAGSARVSSIWVKTASDYQVHLTITGAYMFWVQGFMMGPLYSAIPAQTRAAAEAAFSALPESFWALFGGGNMGSPEGFYQIETFGMMAPVGVMVVAVAIGAGALAGEEAKRTISLLLANPITRARVVAAKAVTMTLFAAAIGLLTFAGVVGGVMVGGLDMDIGHVGAACLLQTLCGLVFGSLALALSAGTGKKRLAIWGAVGAAVFLHVFNALAQLNDKLADWAWISPFHFYLENDPLVNGIDWGDAAILATISAVLIGASFFLFRRRDLRQTD